MICYNIKYKIEMKFFAVTALLGSASATGCVNGIYITIYRDPFCQQKSMTFNMHRTRDRKCLGSSSGSVKYTCSEFGLEIENFKGQGCHSKISETFFAWGDCYQDANDYVKYSNH